MGYKFNPFTGNLDLVNEASPEVTPGGSDTQVQYNNAGSFDGSADLTWDDTVKELGVGGDITLDDGGTFSTTLQMVTATANRTISFPDATGTVALVAGSSGQVAYNNAGVQAGLTSANIGSTGEINISLAGAVSTPPVSFTGSWFTGGTATTTKPQLLIEPTGTTSTAWSTSGTGLGVNAASGFSGRLLDLQTNGTSRMLVQGDGKVGVGTSSPQAKLQVYGDIRCTFFGDGSDFIGWGSPTSTAKFAYISATDEGPQNVGLSFNVTTNAGTSNTEAIRIDDLGNVGIGTTSPNAPLDVNGVIHARSSISFRSGATVGGSIVTTAAGRLKIGSYNATGADHGEITFTRNNTAGDLESARIDSSGRLLVGTSSAFANNTSINIQATASTGCRIALGRNDSTVSTDNIIGGITFQGNDSSGTYEECARIFAEADGSHGDGDKPTRLVFSTTADGASSPTTRMTIKSDGRVGIGTTSPSSLLHLTPSVGDGIQISANGKITREAEGLRITGSSTVHNISFVTAGSEACRIDTSGRLLVGTSTSIGQDATTQIRNDSNGYGLSLQRSGDTTNPVRFLAERSRGSVGTPTALQDDDQIWEARFYGYEGSAYHISSSISAEVDGTVSDANDSVPGRLVFSTTADGASSPTPRMRIRQNGQLNTLYSGTYGLVLQSTQASSSSRYLIWGSHSANDIIGNGATNVFQVETDGDVKNTNNSYGGISDIKLKENIVDANSQWDDLKALQVRNYNFKEGQTHTQIGLVAQEVELVSPGLVSESPDLDEEGNDLGTVTKSVNYSVLYMKAVKALQEAMERIETLEQRLSDAGIA